MYSINQCSRRLCKLNMRTTVSGSASKCPKAKQTVPAHLQFKGDITELEELRELKEDVARREQAQATLIQSQASGVGEKRMSMST